MEGDLKNGPFSLIVPKNPDILHDERLKELEHQYHNAYIELREIARAYNNRIKELDREKE